MFRFCGKILFLFALVLVTSVSASALKTRGKHGAKPFKPKVSIFQSMTGACQQSPLLMAEYQVKAAGMRLSSANREWFPTAEFKAKYSHDSANVGNSGYASSVGGNNKTESKIAQLRVEQNVYNGGATLANIKAASKQLEASSADFVATEKSILKKSIDAHIGCYTRQQVLSLARNNENLLRESLRIAKNQYKFGERTLYDAAATRAKWEKARSEVLSAEAEYRASLASYIKETGSNPDNTELAPGEYIESLVPKTKEEAVFLALQHSPELKKKDADAEIALADADKNKANLLPSLSIGATANHSRNETKNSLYPGASKTRNNNLGTDVTLNIPLDFRGSTQTNVKGARYIATQKKLEALYQRREIVEKTAQAWAMRDAAVKKVSQVKEQVKAAKIAVKMAKEEFMAGTKQTLDVLSAEQEYFSAQVDLVKAEQGEVSASYNLLDAIGLLRALYLNLEAPVYLPEKESMDVPIWGIDIEEDKRIDAVKASNNEMIEWSTTKL